jgi:hypothetical protein
MSVVKPVMMSTPPAVNAPVAMMLSVPAPGTDMDMPRNCSIGLTAAGLAGLALAAATPLMTAATDTAPTAAMIVLRIPAFLSL